MQKILLTRHVFTVEMEKKRAFEMEIKAKTFADKLQKTKEILEEIERQKGEANHMYKLQLEKKSSAPNLSGLNDGLMTTYDKLTSGTRSTRVTPSADSAPSRASGAEGGEKDSRLKNLVDTMNLDLFAKMSTIQGIYPI